MAINRNNYEEYFLLYIDRELGRDEQLMVEDYVRLHPDLEKEFDLLKQTIALPPVTIFEGKEKLFKEEKKRRILPVFWMRIAATLIILLAGGWFLLLMTGETKNAKESAKPAKQIALQQEGSKKKIPESSIRPADPANSGNPENLQKGNPVVVTNSAGGQKEHGIPGTKTKSTSGNRANPENNPEPGEAFNPSTVNRQPSTESINPQPSAKANIPDLAQNNKFPEINAPNPSTIHHPPSTVLPSTVNRQPSTNPEDSQSILVFNNDNKTVSGFFKKLLAKSGDEQVTAENRKRKIKISVFQFNVSK